MLNFVNSIEYKLKKSSKQSKIEFAKNESAENAQIVKKKNILHIFIKSGTKE